MTARSVLRRLHGRTAPGAPRWAVRTAYAVTLTTLPSCVWRIAAVCCGAPLMRLPATPQQGHGPVLVTGTWYIYAICLVSEALAYLAVGLVADWGEVWPRWIPRLGGRRVPVPAAVVPAALGATVLTLFTWYTFLMFALGRMINGARGSFLHLDGWQTVAFVAAYGPLLAWGPLLGLLTVHYHRRRRPATRRTVSPAALPTRRAVPAPPR
ncbi:hypothetical protein GCM10009665_03050 [Kitasatospora nipponensis]|uniref:DUF3995 domain-containing protein n=1 Tax=Kitasatospora nipponensis TaxID=258049 RepID=A0ABN1VNG6_9ACTN